MTNTTFRLMIIGVLLLLTSGSMLAGTVNLVAWAPQSTVSSSGTGTLVDKGQIVTVTLSTLAVVNAGMTFTPVTAWDDPSNLATYLGETVTPNIENAFGTAAGSSSTEVIQFSSAVTNPILFLNCIDPDTFITLTGSPSVTLLSSNHVQLSGDTLTFNGALNTLIDGAAIQFNGTFRSITFQYIDTNSSVNRTMGFNVGVSNPEPMSAAMLISGLGLVALVAKRKLIRER